MAVTKTARTIQASTSVSAGATQNGAEIDLATALGMAITARVTNGGTGPTIGCTAIVEVRESGSGSWRTWAQATAPVTASAVTDFAWEVPPAVIRARVTFTGHTGQAVTVEAIGHELTSL
jgi:hypothetical protein